MARYLKVIIYEVSPLLREIDGWHDIWKVVDGHSIRVLAQNLESETNVLVEMAYACQLHGRALYIW